MNQFDSHCLGFIYPSFSHDKSSSHAKPILLKYIRSCWKKHIWLVDSHMFAADRAGCFDQPGCQTENLQNIGFGPRSSQHQSIHPWISEIPILTWMIHIHMLPVWNIYSFVGKSSRIPCFASGIYTHITIITKYSCI